MRPKAAHTGSQVSATLQLLCVMSVLQEHTVGCSLPEPGGDGQGSCCHAEGLAADDGGLRLTESDVLGQMCLAGCWGSLLSTV